MKRVTLIFLSILLVVKLVSAQTGFNTLTNLSPVTITSNTSTPAQSKIWTYAGKQWAVLCNAAGTNIYRLDGNSWTNILALAAGSTAKADIKVVGNVTHIFTWKGATSYLYSVQYDAPTNKYKLWTVRNTRVTLTLDAGVLSGTIDIDGTGRMWLASDGNQKVNVRWSDAPYATWSSPIVLASGLTTTDLCGVIAMPASNKIGVFWSNKTTKRFGFVTHADGALPATWSADEAPASQSALNAGTGFADNQFNVKALANGNLVCAVKTGYNLAGYTQIGLLLRHPNATWDPIYPVTINEGTNPVVIVNDSANKLKVIYTLASGSISYKESSATSISFGSAFTLISGAYDFATSSKANYSSDVVVMASNSTTGVGILGADNTGSRLDETPPTADSIKRLSPLTQTTNATDVVFRVFFSEPVTGVDAADFTLTAGGTVTSTIGANAITAVAGSNGASYDVTVSSIAGNGNLRLDLNSSGTGIADIASNPIATGFNTGESYTIQQMPPTMISVGFASSNALPSYAKTGDIVSLSFTASELINPPVVTIATHPVTATAGSGNSFVATYTMTATDAFGTIPFTVNFSNAIGTPGTQVSTTTNGSTVSFDNTIPSVVSISRQTPLTATTNASSVTFRVIFSEPVTGVDVADFTITAGGTVTNTMNANAIAAVAGSNGASYDVTVSSVGGSGSLRLDLNSNGTGIADVAGNAITTGYNTGEFYTIQQTQTLSIINLSPVTIASNTSTPAQSKIWTYAGKQWAVLGSATGTNIYRLDGNSWTNILALATGGTAKADIKVVGNVTHIFTWKGATSYLYSVQYDAPTNKYKLWTVRNTRVTLTLDAGVLSGTIDIDGTGRMWLASDGNQKVNVRWSDAPYATWSSPIILASGLTTTDLCGVIAMPASNKIGVFWSNKTTKRFGFVTHADGALPATWSADEAPASQSALNAGTGFADNQFNVKALANGNLVCAVKTGYNLAGYTQIGLLLRHPNATWDPIYPVTINEGTNPVVIVNDSANKLKVIYTLASGSISYKESSATSISFGSAITLISGAYDFATSAKANYSSDVVVMASNSTTGVGILGVDNTGSRLDQTPPTADSIKRLSPLTQTTNATAVVFRVFFSEPVTGVDAADFTLTAGGTVTSTIGANAITAVAGSNGASYDVTVSSIAGNGNLRLDLNSSGTGIADIASNPIATGFNTGESYAIQQTTQPTMISVGFASSNALPSYAKTGDIVSLSFTASELINPPVVTIATHPVTATAGSGNSFVATYTMTATDAFGTIPFTVNFSNAIGTPGTQVSTTTNGSTVSFDNTIPSVLSISRQTPLTATTNAPSVTFRVVFSERVIGVDVTDFAITTLSGAVSGVLTGSAVSAVDSAGTTYDVTISSISGDGSLRLDIISAGNGIADSAGNTIIGGFTGGESYAIQQALPILTTVTITSNNANASLAKAGNIVILNFTASQAISAPVVTIATHSVTATAGSGNSFVATYTMTASDAFGTIPFTVDFSNAIGTPGTQVSTTTNGSTVSFDNTIPSVLSISRQTPLTATTNAPSVTFRVVFSERVIGVDVTDFAITTLSGAVSGVLTGSAVSAVDSAGTTYDVTISSISGDGSLRLDIISAGNGIADSAGNTIIGGFTGGESYAIQQALPILTTVTITSNNANASLAKAGNIVTLNFTASQAISAPVVTIATHSVTATAGSGNSFVATYTMTATDAFGTIPFTVDFSNTIGTPGTQVNTTTNGGTVRFDNTVPSVVSISRQTPLAATTNAASVTYRVIFSEQVIGVDVTDFVITTLSGTVSGVLAGGAVTSIGTTGTTYDVTVSSISNEGSLRLDIISAGNGIADSAGNTIIGGFTGGESYAIQQSAIPVLTAVSITSNNANTSLARAGNIVTLNFTASQAINTPVVTIAARTVTATATGSPNNYTASYTTITANPNGIVPFTINFSNPAGTKGTTVTTTTDGSSVTFDKTPPFVVSISRLNPLTASTTATSITFRVIFSEKVSGVDQGDFLLTLVSGSARGSFASYAVNPVGTDGTTYDVTLSFILGNGVLRLDLKTSNTSISDMTGNLIASGYSIGETYTVQQTVSNGSFTSVTPLTPLDVTTATKDKPQAKVWTYAGSWWAALPGTGGTKIFRLDGTSWTDILTLSTKSQRPDCWVVGDMVHVLCYMGADKNSVLYSVKYDTATNTYKLWTARPTGTNLYFPVGSETSTIVVDNTGRMWAATDAVSAMSVWYSDAPYTTWSAPITIATGMKDDDICSLIAMPGQGKIGLFWSNQITKRFGFRTHSDGTDPTVWSDDEVPASQSAVNNAGGGMADDHMNLKVASDGTIYVAAKTSYNAVGYPHLILLVRRPNGVWDDQYVVAMDLEGTQPIVLLNETKGTIKVVYASLENGGYMLYRESLMSTIGFGPGITLINTPGVLYDYATSTHQNYNSSIVILATNLTASPQKAIGFIATDGVSGLIEEGQNALVKVNDNGENTFRAFPNPLSKTATLTFGLSEAGNYNIVLYNSQGIQQMIVKRGWADAGVINKITLDANSLANGIYIVNLKSGKSNQSIKILVQK